MTEQFVNNVSTTLNGAILAGATSITVTSAAAFPATGTYTVEIDAEYFLCGTRTGNVIPVTPGSEGTTQAAHGNGATVTIIQTARGMNNLQQKGSASGLAAARPTASGSGCLYLCDDIPVLYFDDPVAAAWKQYVVVSAAPAPPTAASYTVVGNFALAQMGDALRATMFASTASVGAAALIASASLGATSTWIVELAFMMTGLESQTYPEAGPCVSNGTVAGTSVVRDVDYFGNGANYGIQQETFTLNGAQLTLNAQILGVGATTIGDPSTLMRMRLLNDATHLHYQRSSDGIFWFDVYTEVSPTGLTNYGFHLGLPIGSAEAFVNVMVYKNALLSLSVAQATITGATNATPIVVTTSAPHNFLSGDFVAIHGVGGNTAANTATGVTSSTIAAITSSFLIHVLSPTTFELVGRAGNGAYTSGGVATLTSR